MKSFHIPRTAVFFILFALAAFAVLYHPIDLKALVRASSQGTLRTEEVAHFGRQNFKHFQCGASEGMKLLCEELC